MRDGYANTHLPKRTAYYITFACGQLKIKRYLSQCQMYVVYFVEKLKKASSVGTLVGLERGVNFT